ncbi:nucleolar complex protein 14 [Ascosphaera aggregata]|nr:nucleolar complex protein 14 [Ascosphaera aggregata]
MPPSQLKQLKASLRESGALGPQLSKKQKKKNARSGAAADTRQKRNAALLEIRERFNPFEYKAPARGNKFDVTMRHPTEVMRHRPGVTKGLGEERRKETLLKELHSRKKVGALYDRRFGENDPTMTPEERAAERFARESMKKAKKDSLFNLEDDDDEELQLTHLGRGLDLNEEGDDFQEKDLEESDGEDTLDKKRKRWKAELDDLQMFGGEEGGEAPERKKSKHEVMKEIIAKSKFHKYERQKAKEDDDDIREILDKGLPEIFDVLKGVVPEPPKPAPAPAAEMPLNPDRAALISGKNRDDADREYDQRLKQLTFDKRSQPQDRTKSAEETAQEEAERLKRLELERLRRMQGEEDEESADNQQDEELGDEEGGEELPDDARAFGLHSLPHRPDMAVEDEDEFVIDSDIVDSDSEGVISLDESDESEDDESDDDAEEREFVGDLKVPPSANIKSNSIDMGTVKSTQIVSDKLAYTYPCPETEEQFIEITKEVDLMDLPIVVQRIRALYHPRLHPDNKTKLAKFAEILVQHVNYLANLPEHPPFVILENMLRHVHSLAKSYPEAVAAAFRNHLRDIFHHRSLSWLPGDLVILNGIATIFPTSDHFHPVVTPSNLTMARYLSHSTINNLGELITGVYISSLLLQYQTFAKRYIPEFMNYTLNALCALSPVEPKNRLGTFFLRNPAVSLRLRRFDTSVTLKKLEFWDLLHFQGKEEDIKLSIIHALVTLMETASELWSSKLAFCDIFAQARRVLRFLAKACDGKIPSSLADQIQRAVDKLQRLMKQSDLARRPLLLHYHRPLAIKTAIPKFEETFNPDRHYDPDRERAELNKLKKEHKRERKGALRELRKDANFIARESLREKRERDEEYQRKYRRLIAEVQGEEGREANAYEKIKRARKGLR